MCESYRHSRTSTMTGFLNTKASATRVRSVVTLRRNFLRRLSMRRCVRREGNARTLANFGESEILNFPKSSGLSGRVIDAF